MTEEGTESTTHLTTAERLAKAEESQRKAEAHRDRLRRVATAEAEIPGVWETGNVSKEGLAKQYEISVATVSRILESAGVVMTRVKRISDATRKEIETLLREGTSSKELQEVFQISHNTVRKIGLDAGIFAPGERRPQRTDDEYRNIQELDELARQRFGSGIYNLGVGLRAWEKKQKQDATTPPPPAAPVEAPSEPQPVDQTGQAIPTPAPSPAPVLQPSPPLPVDEGPTPDFESDPAPVTPAAEPATEEPDFKF